MADGITIKVEGLKELNNILEQVPTRFRKRAVINSLKAGARLVQKDARRRAPRGRTGNLRRAIIVRNSKINNGRRGRGLLGIYLGLRNFSRVKAGTNRNAYYARFVNDGYNVKGKSRGNQRGVRGRKTLPGRRNIPGKRFIGKAFRSRRQSAIKLIFNSADKFIRAIARQLNLKVN